MPLIDYSASNPFDKVFRIFGTICHGITTSLPPNGRLGNIALPTAFSVLQKELLPSTLAVDALRGVSSFMADGNRLGENTFRTSVDMLGELAGGFACSAAGLSGGQLLGASIGSVVAGPLGAISGGSIGGVIGSIGASLGGSYAGAVISEHLAERFHVFSGSQKSYFAARSPK